MHEDKTNEYTITVFGDAMRCWAFMTASRRRDETDRAVGEARQNARRWKPDAVQGGYRGVLVAVKAAEDMPRRDDFGVDAVDIYFHAISSSDIAASSA